MKLAAIVATEIERGGAGSEGEERVIQVGPYRDN